MRSLDTPVFRYTFGPHPPALRVADGETVELVCPDSDNAGAGGTELPEHRRDRAGGRQQVEGNPLAGPLYLEGAEPGDALAVRIDRITLDRDYGQTLLAKGHGVVPADYLEAAEAMPRHLYRWRFDHSRGVAQLENPMGPLSIEAPLEPFVGAVGVCPVDRQPIGALAAGAHGGNLDLKPLRPGATIFFPVYVPGALLMLGDLHAGQGDGELVGGGIETSGRVVCTLRRLPGDGSDDIRFMDAHSVGAVAVHADLRTAVQRAVAALVRWLSTATPAARWDLYQLVSQTARIHLGNLNAAPFPVAASVPRSVLPRAVAEALERCA